MNFEILRTPEDRFDNLPDYPFKPNYKTVDGIRIHYVDEGPKNGEVILLLHGEPSWSFLYRKMIKILSEKGYRVIAPDLIGFGKSDKLARQKDHSYELHVNAFTQLVNSLNISDINLFIQDWGGLVGLRIIHNLPDKFSRIMAANTGLPAAGGLKGLFGHFLFKLKIKQTGKITREQLTKRPGFVNWVAYSQTTPDFPVGDIIQGATVRELSEDEIRAYNAPFPDESYKEGPRIMPMLVTSQLKYNQKVWKETLSKWDKPFLTAFSDMDPITRGGDKLFKKKVPGAKKIDHIVTKNAGHFLQEDKSEELASNLIKFIVNN